MEPGGSSNTAVWNILKGNIVGGLLLSSFTVPTDVLRNYWYFNVELKGRRSSVTTLDVGRHIYQTKGAKCFFTGFYLTVFNVIAGQTIFLVSYDRLKSDMSPPMASVLGRMITLLSMQPIECMRTFTQANISKSMQEFFRDVKGLSTVRALYKGFVPTVIRDVPFSALHWPVNDLLYRNALRYTETPEEKATKLQKLSLSFATGAISSSIATIVSQPFDIVKTKIQANADHKTKMTLINELSKFFGQYGMRGFSVGLTPRLIKVVPGCAIISGFYRYFN